MTNAIRLTRRHALKLATAGAAAIALPTRAQSDWPTRPIKIIVPLQPGGVGDIYARSVAERLQVTLRQPVVIENKPGGLYTIGMQALAAAPADGYTFMQINAGMLAFQATQKKYEVEKLLPISEANAVPSVLFASAKAPFKTAQEMVAWGRANPGQINYCSLGPGSLEHLLGFVLTKAAGIEATHIPYKGGPDFMKALVQGDVQVAPTVYPLGKPFLESGQVRLLGVFADQRLASLPNVPTLKELGLDVPSTEYWLGFAAQPGTPTTIVETMRREIASAVAFPAARERIEAGGGIASSSASTADFAKKIARDLNWISNAVRSANLNLS